MSLARPTFVSEEEFLDLPETMDRIELLDGEVIVSPSPSVWHQELLSRVVQTLRTWTEEQGHGGFVGQSPLDVRFGSGRILQPDAFLVLGGVSLEHEGPIEQIPDLCLEVLSTNRAYDRLTKRIVFATAGVRELWLVEPSGSIERWHGQGLNEAEVLADVLRTPLLPEYRLDVTQLFRRT